jgi:hypothetical protein
MMKNGEDREAGWTLSETCRRTCLRLRGIAPHSREKHYFEQLFDCHSCSNTHSYEQCEMIMALPSHCYSQSIVYDIVYAWIFNPHYMYTRRIATTYCCLS